jgi:uncharacterized protein
MSHSAEMRAVLPLDGTTFGQPGAAVHLLQTHIGWIYLVADFAFKLKKRVKFDFLDFTTLEQRHWACEREINLNRRLCPELYIGLQPVLELPGGTRRVDLTPLGNSAVPDVEARSGAKVIDWAVWMKRLPESRMLDLLLDRNLVSVAQVEQMAAVLGDFYRTHRGLISPNGLGDFDAVSANVEENLREGKELASDILSQGSLGLIDSRARHFLQRHGEMIRQRAAHGFVVDGHGDLRSENICLPENAAPVFFDCIEFNDRFRICDSALDIAFLAMDLESRGHESLSRAFLDKYRSVCDATLPSRLLDFYLGYRAFVKAKVAAWIARDAAVEASQREKSAHQARDLFDLAVRYALRNEKLLIVFCGVSGSGKSTLCVETARRLRCAHLATDLLRDEIVPHGTAPDARYALAISFRVYRLMLQRAGGLLAQGKTVLLDGTFTSSSTRAMAIETAKACGALCLLVWADCPPQTIEAHIMQRTQDQKLFGSEAGLEVARKQRAGFDKPKQREGFNAILRIDTSYTLDAAKKSVWEELTTALARLVKAPPATQ